MNIAAPITIVLMFVTSLFGLIAGHITDGLLYAVLGWQIMTWWEVKK